MIQYPATMSVPVEQPIRFDFYQGSDPDNVNNQYIEPLSIGTGLDAVSWSYNLNTVTFPTLGGEVTQILSCMIGPITFSGTSSTAKQLQGIYYWFRNYMTLSGLQPDGGKSTRIQTPVVVTYPTRNWKFFFKPTQLTGFQYDTEVIATPWSVTGEVAGWTGVNQTGESNPFAVETMQVLDGTKSLGDALNNKLTLQTFANVGFDLQSPYIDPSAPQNQDNGINNFGDNFQRLVASLATGQYNPDIAFDPTATPGSQFKDTADQYYQNYLGTDLVKGGTDNSSSGSATAGTITASSTEAEIAGDIAAAFEAANIPGALGVTTALIETGDLNPDAYEGSGVSGEGIGLFQDSNQGAESSTSQWKAAHTSVAGKPHGTYASISANYPANLQISNAVNRFKNGQPAGTTFNDSSDLSKMAGWAFNVQRGEGYTTNDTSSGSATSEFLTKWAQAQILITQSKQTPTSSASGTSLPTTTGTTLTNAVLNHSNFLGWDNEEVHQDLLNYASRGIKAVVLQGMVAIMDAGWSLHPSAIGKLSHAQTNDSGDAHGHWAGYAFDTNNYGAGGAFSQLGRGTSNPDPSDFIAFLKKNQTALGSIYTGYSDSNGGPVSKGASFADNPSSLHIQFGAP